MSTEPKPDAAQEEEGTPLTPGGRRALTGFVVAVLAFVGWYFAQSPMFKPTITTVALTGIGQPGEQAVALAGGTRIGFGMRAEDFSYAGPDYVVIRVELLREGRAVATMRCRTFELEGDVGSGSGVTQYNSDCQMGVPAGGATAIRAVASQEGEGTLRLSGVTLPVYRP
ncbi:MAG: hypothetical protein U0324_10220 [Polyangiales bacterium]